MSDAPLVSVLLPVRDAAATVDECLRSVLSQTLGDLEVVVVDDGSVDTTAAMVARRATRDARVRLLRQPAHGLVGALNAGLAECHAPLVARIDGDDRMHPERLRLQADFLRAQPHVGVVGSRVRAFPSTQVGGGFEAYVRWQNACLGPAEHAEQIYVEAPLAHPSATIRTTVLRAVGGYREGDFPEDYDLWLRLVAAGVPIAKLPHVLLDWRQDPGSASRTDPRYARTAFDRLRASFLARDPRLHCGRPLAVWGAGRRTRLRVRNLLDRGHEPVLWVDIDPRKIGRDLHGVPVVAPPALASVPGPRPFVLVYVTNHGAREIISACLQTMRYVLGRDFLFVG